MRETPKGLLYPAYRGALRGGELVALSLGKTIGFCPVCGSLTVFGPWTDNLRESGDCHNCQATNRHRQIAYLLRFNLAERLARPVRSLAGLRQVDVGLYNTESAGPLHQYLSTAVAGYTCSEYFGPDYGPGQTVDGIRNEDLTRLSFPGHSFDFVVSSDVLEHVPLPYRAHEEIFRVLKPGGRHVFTVPFHQSDYLDDMFAVPGVDGTPKLLKEALYHRDPLRAEGALVYTVFSLEMLIKLRRIGFQTRMYRLYDIALGILGRNGIVFEAIKTDQ